MATQVCVRTCLLGSGFIGLIFKNKSLNKFESFAELDEFVNGMFYRVKAL